MTMRRERLTLARPEATPPAVELRPLPALFVGCSESLPTVSLIESVAPEQVMTNFGGMLAGDETLDAAQRATLAYAVDVRGIRDVVLFGHSRCRYPAWSRGLHDGPEDTRRQLAAQMRVLKRFVPSDVRINAFWLDERSGCFHRLVDERQPTFERIDDAGFVRFVLSLEQREP